MEVVCFLFFKMRQLELWCTILKADEKYYAGIFSTRWYYKSGSHFSYFRLGCGLPDNFNTSISTRIPILFSVYVEKISNSWFSTLRLLYSGGLNLRGYESHMGSLSTVYTVTVSLTNSWSPYKLFPWGLQLESGLNFEAFHSLLEQENWFMKGSFLINFSL